MGESILVRATISLSGLDVGDHAWVDPETPYIAMCLERSYLVPVAETELDESG